MERCGIAWLPSKSLSSTLKFSSTAYRYSSPGGLCAMPISLTSIRPVRNARLWPFLVCRRIERHRRTANGMPGGNPADECPGVITSPSQFGHGRTADLESANAVDGDRAISREFLDPPRKRGRRVHGGACQHIRAPWQIPGKTEIQKHRSAIALILERQLQLLGRNPRLFLRWCPKGQEKMVFFRSFADCHAIPRVYPLPI